MDSGGAGRTGRATAVRCPGRGHGLVAVAPACPVPHGAVEHRPDGPGHGAGAAPALAGAPAGRHGPSLPPAQVGGHWRGRRGHRALGLQGVERLDQGPVGPRRQTRARRRAALAHRRARPCQGPGRMGLLPAAGHGGRHAADPAAVLQALAPAAPRHAAAVPGAGTAHGSPDAALLLGAAAGPAHGHAAGAGQLGGPLVAGGPDRPRAQPPGAYPCRARARRWRPARTRRGGLLPARQLAKPPCGAVRLRALRPCGGTAPLHHRQRPRQPGAQRPGRAAAAPGHQATGRLHPHPGPAPARGPARGHRRPLRPLRRPGPPAAPAGVGGGRRGRDALPGAAGGTPAGRGPARAHSQPVHMHYCTRDAARDPLLPRLRQLCAQAQPPVRLSVHDDALGQRLTPQALEATAGPLDIWFCGPQGWASCSRRTPAARVPGGCTANHSPCVDPVQQAEAGTQLCFGLRSRMPPLERP